jgi:adenosylcobinamide-phosphate synthase
VNEAVAALAVALVLDLAFGDPPNAFHPVAWIGQTISLTMRAAPARGAYRQLAFGAAVAVLVPSFAAGLAFATVHSLGGVRWARFIVTVLLLKSTFSLRGLAAAAGVVRAALLRRDLAAARRALGSLCSRDATQLDEPALVAASVESVAENTSDSVVAPLLYYVLFGVAGAVFYRAVNTLDAMIGYRGRYEWLGKASARTDDLLNLVPARLTAALLLASGVLARRDVRGGLRVLRRDRARTESPNAGRPMATMAGLLRVELTKVGCYRLGDSIDALAPAKIRDAVVLMGVASCLAFALAGAALGATRGPL